MKNVKKLAVVCSLALAAFPLVSCRSYVRERVSSDECLVLVRCEVSNPDNAKQGRFFKFRLSSGEQTAFIRKEYAAIYLAGPGAFISGVASEVGEGFRGDMSFEDVQIPLPYEPGAVLVADAVFVHVLKKIDATTVSSGYRFAELEETSRRATLDAARGDLALRTWFYAPDATTALGRTAAPLGGDSTAARIGGAASIKPGVIRVTSDRAGLVRIEGHVASPIKPGETLTLEAIPPGSHTIALQAEDGMDFSQTADLKPGAKITVNFLTALEVAKATAGVGADYAGPGYTVRQFGLPPGWLRAVYVFIDGEDVYVHTEYQSSFRSACSFFNPPQGSIFMIKDQSGINIGRGSITFRVRADRLDFNRDATVLLYEHDASPGFYIRLTSGVAGLTALRAPDRLRAAANR